MGADGVGGVGAGMEKASPWNRHFGGSFRITNGVNGGLKPSIKYYASGWTGGSRARITTYGMGSLVGKVGTVGSVVVGGFQIAEGVEQDGGTYGKNAQIATGNVAGGMVGGWAGGVAGAEAGATVGAAVGVWFGGVGAAPGAAVGAIVGGIIGSVGGGWLGGNIGAEAVRQGQEVYNNANPNNL